MERSVRKKRIWYQSEFFILECDKEQRSQRMLKRGKEMKKVYILELLFGMMLMASAGILYSSTAKVNQEPQYRIHSGYVVGVSKKKQWKFIQRTKVQKDMIESSHKYGE